MKFTLYKRAFVYGLIVPAFIIIRLLLITDGELLLVNIEYFQITMQLALFYIVGLVISVYFIFLIKRIKLQTVAKNITMVTGFIIALLVSAWVALFYGLLVPPIISIMCGAVAGLIILSLFYGISQLTSCITKVLSSLKNKN